MELFPMDNFQPTYKDQKIFFPSDDQNDHYSQEDSSFATLQSLQEYDKNLHPQDSIYPECYPSIPHSTNFENPPATHSKLQKVIRDPPRDIQKNRVVNKKRTALELDEEYAPDTDKKSPVETLEEPGTENSEMVKNYLPIVTNVFSQKSLEIENESMQGMILAAIIRSGVEDVKEMKEKVLDYIKKSIAGKVDYTSSDDQKSRQYKIRSKTQMKKVFQAAEGDSHEISKIKAILRILIEEFLRSKVFLDWVNVEYSTKKPKNKLFLSDESKRNEMIKVFTKERYRPKFHGK